MSKLSHDRSSCIHCGACVSVCSDLFDSEGDITLKNAVYENNVGVLEIGDDKKECAQNSVNVCPVGSIKLE